MPLEAANDNYPEGRGGGPGQVLLDIVNRAFPSHRTGDQFRELFPDDVSRAISNLPLSSQWKSRLQNVQANEWDTFIEHIDVSDPPNEVGMYAENNHHEKAAEVVMAHILRDEMFRRDVFGLFDVQENMVPGKAFLEKMVGQRPGGMAKLYADGVSTYIRTHFEVTGPGSVSYGDVPGKVQKALLSSQIGAGFNERWNNVFGNMLISKRWLDAPQDTFHAGEVETTLEWCAANVIESLCRAQYPTPTSPMSKVRIVPVPGTQAAEKLEDARHMCEIELQKILVSYAPAFMLRQPE